MPTNLTTLYCTEDDLLALYSSAGIVGRVDDDNDASIGAGTPSEQEYLDKARQWATAKINDYCLGLYAAADLATSWVINELCVILACRWLSCRRGNPPPESTEELYKEAIARLEKIRTNEHPLADVGQRDSAWPCWTNFHIEPTYRLRKIRIERPLSEKTPVPYQQPVDWPSEVIFEP